MGTISLLGFKDDCGFFWLNISNMIFLTTINSITCIRPQSQLNHEQPTASRQLPAASCPFQAASRQLPAASCIYNNFINNTLSNVQRKYSDC